MALMLRREPNRVKWVGVRPGHNGEQILKSNAVNNATGIVHTVTASKTFYMTGFQLAYEFTAVGVATFAIRNAIDAQTAVLFQISPAVAHNGSIANSFDFQPIEIPAEYDIYIISSVAAVTIRAHISGWEE